MGLPCRGALTRGVPRRADVEAGDAKPEAALLATVRVDPTWRRGSLADCGRAPSEPGSRENIDPGPTGGPAVRAGSRRCLAGGPGGPPEVVPLGSGARPLQLPRRSRAASPRPVCPDVTPSVGDGGDRFAGELAPGVEWPVGPRGESRRRGCGGGCASAPRRASRLAAEAPTGSHTRPSAGFRRRGDPAGDRLSKPGRNSELPGRGGAEAPQHSRLGFPGPGAQLSSCGGGRSRLRREGAPRGDSDDRAGCPQAVGPFRPHCPPSRSSSDFSRAVAAHQRRCLFGLLKRTNEQREAGGLGGAGERVKKGTPSVLSKFFKYLIGLLCRPNEIRGRNRSPPLQNKLIHYYQPQVLRTRSPACAL
ncbi:collagen alpha-1(I) chain-like [Hippopotamus amphibius kiboko]|uniref:collagen alpha-1(I) chain-like n=1 Tax=Hippopotamus amphibius kiboko TaxID=575201 RepID=UPI0025948A5E|nr:collagen alpha-1(I) chain-like [Hippopotamus amphibius kiboko]